MHDKNRDNTGKLRHARLFEVVSEQGGYLTAAQARACGFSKALLELGKRGTSADIHWP